MIKLQALLFGTGGIPLSTPNASTTNGIAQVKKLGLGCMELEFVHSINISKDKAPEVRAAAKEHDVVLTCHAPYYINLNTSERAKLAASKKRIIDSARILSLCGGWSLCFHPAFYMKADASKVYDVVKLHVKEIVKTLKDDGVDVWIRPETTGKPTAFGTLKEILKLSQEVEQVMPCIDFAHLHAREGKNNTHEEFRAILEQVEEHLGREGLNNMHIHMSGIAYSDKGEKHHLNLKQSDFKYEELIKVWKEFKINGTVISESQSLEGDALLMQALSLCNNLFMR